MTHQTHRSGFITVPFLSLFILTSLTATFGIAQVVDFLQPLWRAVTPEAVCSELTYPEDQWQRVWYDQTFSTCFGDGPNEIAIKFYNDWGQGVLAYEQKYNIGFRSGRTIYLDAGTYTFTLGSDDGGRLWIDDAPCINQGTDHPYTESSCTKTFDSSGEHRFRIDYYESGGLAELGFIYVLTEQAMPGVITVSVAKAQVKYGDTQTWTASGLQPGVEYVTTLRWPGAAMVTWSGTADTNGYAGGSFTVRDDLPGGTITVRVELKSDASIFGETTFAIALPCSSVSLPVTIYSDDKFDWVIREGNVYCDYIAHKADVEAFYAFPVKIYDWYTANLGAQITFKPTFVLIPPGGGYAGGHEFGVSIDAFWGIVNNVKGWWAYQLTAHEFGNLYTGTTMSGGWPCDWWADHGACPSVPGVESPAPATFANVSLAQINWKDSVKVSQDAYNASKSDKLFVLFRDRLVGSYGIGMFTRAFNAIRQDQMQWPRIDNGRNPGALLTNYVTAYLSIGAQTDLSSIFNEYANQPYPAGMTGFDGKVMQDIIAVRNLIYSAASQGASQSALDTAWEAYRTGRYQEVPNILSMPPVTQITVTVDKSPIKQGETQTWSSSGLPASAGYKATLKWQDGSSSGGQGNANTSGYASGSFLIGTNVPAGTITLRVEVSTDASKYGETAFVVEIPQVSACTSNNVPGTPLGYTLHLFEDWQGAGLPGGWSWYSSGNPNQYSVSQGCLGIRSGNNWGVVYNTNSIPDSSEVIIDAKLTWGNQDGSSGFWWGEGLVSYLSPLSDAWAGLAPEGASFPASADVRISDNRLWWSGWVGAGVRTAWIRTKKVEDGYAFYWTTNYNQSNPDASSWNFIGNYSANLAGPLKAALAASSWGGDRWGYFDWIAVWTKSAVSATCPNDPPSYPLSSWDRVWCNKDFTQKLEDAPDQINEQFDENWDTGTVAGIRTDNIGFRSGRTLNLPAGNYTFILGSDDGSRLWIDDQLVIDQWQDQTFTEKTYTQVYTAPGNHKFRIDWYENINPARTKFSYTYTPITISLQIIPAVGKTSIKQGETQTWSVSGLPASAGYKTTLRWSSSVLLLSQGNANASGQASGSFIVGTNIPSGSVTLRVELSTDASKYGEIRFTIETPQTISCSSNSAPGTPSGYALHLFEDWQGSSLPGGWSWYSSGNPNQYSVAQGCLGIRSGNNWGIVHNGNTIAGSDDVIVDAKILWGNQGASWGFWWGGGLVSYLSPLSDAWAGVAPENGSFPAAADVRISDNRLWWSGWVGAGAKTLWVRTKKTGDNYAFYWATNYNHSNPDLSSWNPIGSYTTNLAGPLKPALVTSSWGADRWGYFDWIAVWRKTTAPPPAPINVSIVKSTVTYGETQTWSVSGLPANAGYKATLRWSGNTLLLTQGNSNALGQASSVFTIGTNIPVGTVALRVELSSDGSKYGEATFAVGGCQPQQCPSGQQWDSAQCKCALVSGTCDPPPSQSQPPINVFMWSTYGNGQLRLTYRISACDSPATGSTNTRKAEIQRALQLWKQWWPKLNLTEVSQGEQVLFQCYNTALVPECGKNVAGVPYLPSCAIAHNPPCTTTPCYYDHAIIPVGTRLLTADACNCYTTEDNAYFMAHEFGHLLGLLDGVGGIMSDIQHRRPPCPDHITAIDQAYGGGGVCQPQQCPSGQQWDSAQCKCAPVLTQINVSASKTSVQYGETQTWSASGLPANAGYKTTVRWGSNALLVSQGNANASGQASGSFTVGTSIPVGTVTLRVELSSDASKYGEAAFTVQQSVVQIVVSVGKSTVTQGETQTWYVMGLPSNAAFKTTVRWGSTTILIVQGYANASGQASGSFTVGTNIPAETVTLRVELSSDASKYGETIFTVQQQQVISITAYIGKSTVTYGDTQTWSASGLPANAGYKTTIRWGSNALLVSQGNANASGQASGSFGIGTNIPTGTIALRVELSTDGSKYAETYFTVQQQQQVNITVSVSKSVVNYGDVQTWTASGLPANAGYKATVRWSGTALLITQGNANASGQTSGDIGITNLFPTGTITLRVELASDASKYGEKTFTVQQQQTVSITAYVGKSAVTYGETQTWSASGLPANAGYKTTVRWGSTALLIAQGNANASGQASGSFGIGTNIPTGTVSLRVELATDGTKYGQANFIVLQQQVVNISASVGKSSVSYGETQTWATSGLPANAGYKTTVRWSGNALLIAQGNANASGYASGSFNVATNIPAATVSLRVELATDGTKYGETTFTVTNQSQTTILVTYRGTRSDIPTQWGWRSDWHYTGSLSCTTLTDALKSKLGSSNVGGCLSMSGLYAVDFIASDQTAAQNALSGTAIQLKNGGYNITSVDYWKRQ